MKLNSVFIFMFYFPQFKYIYKYFFKWSTYIFDLSAFGQPQQQQQQQQQNASGTVLKYDAPQGQDTMVKNGVTTNIQTKHQCITAMKQYETKSLEVSLNVYTYRRFLRPLQQMTFKNIVAKEEIAHNEQFLLLPHCL